ncbi:hypothetical protein Mal52_38950 [Symmachiella dynata]|uniref:Uncharacterized protein n=1 Tax=Symmachiella dynata TaxID=2527995 RepID=A0A517ZSC1_9PLAN|nr:hypothetical protein Mal52_38950 [Symmachiella dynata]
MMRQTGSALRGESALAFGESPTRRLRLFTLTRTSFKTRLRLLQELTEQCQWNASEGFETTCRINAARMDVSWKAVGWAGFANRRESVKH